MVGLEFLRQRDRSTLQIVPRSLLCSEHGYRLRVLSNRYFYCSGKPLLALDSSQWDLHEVSRHHLQLRCSCLGGDQAALCLCKPYTCWQSAGHTGAPPDECWRWCGWLLWLLGGLDIGKARGNCLLLCPCTTRLAEAMKREELTLEVAAEKGYERGKVERPGKRLHLGQESRQKGPAPHILSKYK